MTKRKTIPFILLLLSFLFWLYFKPEITLTKQDKHQPINIAFNANNIHTDETGRISYKLFSDKITNFSENNDTIFENPKVIVYVANEKNNETTVWQISSKDGILYQQNKLVLTNDVWVRNLSLDQLVQTMTTQKLTLYLDKKEMSSEQLITWQGPQMRQQGVGMWASLVTEELIVKNNIKAVYLNEKQ